MCASNGGNRHNTAPTLYWERALLTAAHLSRAGLCSASGCCRRISCDMTYQSEQTWNKQRFVGRDCLQGSAGVSAPTRSKQWHIDDRFPGACVWGTGRPGRSSFCEHGNLPGQVPVGLFQGSDPCTLHSCHSVRSSCLLSTLLRCCTSVRCPGVNVELRWLTMGPPCQLCPRLLHDHTGKEPAADSAGCIAPKTLYGLGRLSGVGARGCRLLGRL